MLPEEAKAELKRMLAESSKKRYDFVTMIIINPRAYIYIGCCADTVVPVVVYCIACSTSTLHLKYEKCRQTAAWCPY